MPDNCTVYHRAAGCGVCEFLRSPWLTSLVDPVRSTLAPFLVYHSSRRYLVPLAPHLRLHLPAPDTASLNVLTIVSSFVRAFRFAFFVLSLSLSLHLSLRFLHHTREFFASFRPHAVAPAEIRSADKRESRAHGDLLVESTPVKPRRVNAMGSGFHRRVYLSVVGDVAAANPPTIGIRASNSRCPAAARDTCCFAPIRLPLTTV